MGPPHNLRHIPNKSLGVDSSESDEEMARWRAEGWQVGFNVEMHGVGRDGEEAEDQNTADDRTTSSDADENSVDRNESDGTPIANGYQPLPSSVEPSTAAQWLQPTNINNSLLPAPPEELCSIQHQPVDINMDQAKVEQIKGIMTQISLPAAAPHEWIQQIDDRKLAELLEQLKQRNQQRQ